jgi:hypothetical protein
VDDTRGAHTNETRNLRHIQITLNLHNRTSEYILYFADCTFRKKSDAENNYLFCKLTGVITRINWSIMLEDEHESDANYSLSYCYKYLC